MVHHCYLLAESILLVLGMTPLEYFSACIAFNCSINQTSQWKNFSFTAKCKTHYCDWARLLIADVLDLPNAWKEGGMWVGTCSFGRVDCT